MDPYPAAATEPPAPRRLGRTARRVDWLVASGCLVIALASTVVATVMIGLLTSTCSETGDCDESGRSLAFGLTPIVLLVVVAGVVIATSALHRHNRSAWWTGIVALIVTIVAAIVSVAIGSGSVPPH